MSLFSLSSLMLAPVADLVGSNLLICDKNSSVAKKLNRILLRNLFGYLQLCLGGVKNW